MATGGTTNLPHKALLRCKTQLTLEIASAPSEVSSKLVATGLVPTSLLSSQLPANEYAEEVVTAITNKVEAFPNSLNHFKKVLRECIWLESVMDKISEEYNHLKEENQFSEIQNIPRNNTSQNKKENQPPEDISSRKNLYSLQEDNQPSEMQDIPRNNTSHNNLQSFGFNNIPETPQARERESSNVVDHDPKSGGAKQGNTNVVCGITITKELTDGRLIAAITLSLQILNMTIREFAVISSIPSSVKDQPSRSAAIAVITLFSVHMLLLIVFCSVYIALLHYDTFNPKYSIKRLSSALLQCLAALVYFYADNITVITERYGSQLGCTEDCVLYNRLTAAGTGALAGLVFYTVLVVHQVIVHQERRQTSTSSSDNTSRISFWRSHWFNVFAALITFDSAFNTVSYVSQQEDYCSGMELSIIIATIVLCIVLGFLVIAINVWLSYTHYRRQQPKRFFTRVVISGVLLSVCYSLFMLTDNQQPVACGFNCDTFNANRTEIALQGCNERADSGLRLALMLSALILLSILLGLILTPKQEEPPPSPAPVSQPNTDQQDSNPLQHESTAVIVLRRERGRIETSMTQNMTWLAHEMNRCGLIPDDIHEDVTNPRSLLTETQKATSMFQALMKKVKVNPQNLAKFVDILRMKETQYSDEIELLLPAIA